MAEGIGVPENLARLIESSANLNVDIEKKLILKDISEKSYNEALTLLHELHQRYSIVLNEIPTEYHAKKYQFDGGNIVIITNENLIEMPDKYLSADFETAVKTARGNLKAILDFVSMQIKNTEETISNKQSQKEKQDASSKLIKIESKNGVADLFRIFEFANKSGIISTTQPVNDIVRIAFKPEKSDEQLRNTLDTNAKRSRDASENNNPKLARSPEFFKFTELCVTALENSKLSQLNEIVNKEIQRRKL